MELGTTSVLEVSSLAESSEVLQPIGLTNARLIQRVPGDNHFKEVEQDMLGTRPSIGAPDWVSTGKPQSNQTLRKLLRARKGLFSKERIKAYWPRVRAVWTDSPADSPN
jgi:hypothetical protein